MKPQRRAGIMNWVLRLLLLCTTWGFSAASIAELPNDRPAPAKVQIGGYGRVQRMVFSGATFSVSFPSAMVEAGEIDSEANESPVRFEPPLATKFIWKSQTEGELKTPLVPPGKEFKILLRSGLKDLNGKPVTMDEPLGTRISPEFTIVSTACFEQLNRRPAVPLQLSPGVKPAELAGAAWFQDRDSRERYPVEVVLNDEQRESVVNSATVTPRADLPGGRAYDLVVDGLREAETGTRLPQPYVKHLGETTPLRIKKVAAFNYPMDRPRIVVAFSEPVDR